MGMEDGPFCQLFCLDHRTETCQGYVGRFIQRSAVRSSRLAVSMGRRAVHRPAFSGKPGPAPDASFATTALPLLCDRFLFWRWISITSGPDPITQTWLFDKWHLGPLRLINFAVAASVTATFLKYLNRWEAPLRPFLLIGRHMLPVFCSQICLSVLLIGRTESGLTIEPITSAFVICQLLTAPLFAWFLELRSLAS
jgi:hypothetical protein